jgi:N-acetylmuramoyl-L-alanine amidase
MAIVIHLMDGTLTGTDAWFMTTPANRKKSNPAAMASSAHYGIGQNGTVHQYVKDEDTAFHAGRVLNPTWKKLPQGEKPNAITIGIEHEGKVDTPWTDAIYAASAALIAGLAAKWQIPIDRDHIVGHREIFAGKSCPGPIVDLDRLVNAAKSLATQPDDVAPPPASSATV